MGVVMGFYNYFSKNKDRYGRSLGTEKNCLTSI